MLLIYIVFVLLPISTFSQEFPLTNNTNEPVLVWSVYNESCNCAVFNFAFTNFSDLLNLEDEMTIARPNVTLERVFYITNLRGMASDFARQRMIIADWLSGMVGEFSLSGQIRPNYNQVRLSDGTVTEFGGYSQFDQDELQDQIRSLAFTEDVKVDWITGNIYYTRLNTILVINGDIDFYHTAVSDAQGRITALALHPVRREMFYSTFGSIEFSSFGLFDDRGELWRADLAGENRRRLFDQNQINRTTGIAIDFRKPNKLYFTDVSSTSSRLLSSGLTGREIETVREEPNTIFQQLAVFEGKIYIIGEVRGDRDQYRLWVIVHGTTTRFQPITLRTMPMSIDLLVDYIALYNEPAANGTGSCAAARQCDRLCLPRATLERKCVCPRSERLRMSDNTCIVDTPSGGGNPSGGDEGSAAGPILFVVLIPIVAVIVVVAWFLYRRRQRQNEKKDHESPTNTNLLDKKEENSNGSENKQGDEEEGKKDDKPQTSNDDVADDKPGTSKSGHEEKPSSSKTNQAEGDQRSMRSQRSSRGYYDERDMRYSKGYYVEDGRYSRGHYDGRDPRSSRAYDDRDPRYARDYYREGDRYFRDPRASRGYYDGRGGRSSRGYYDERDPRYSSRLYSGEEERKTSRDGSREKQTMPETNHQRGNPPSRQSSRHSRDGQLVKNFKKESPNANSQTKRNSMELQIRSRTNSFVENQKIRRSTADDLPPPPDPLGAQPHYLNTVPVAVHRNESSNERAQMMQ